MYKGETKSPGMVVLLGIITCGIYTIIWTMKMVEDINGIRGKEEVSLALAIVGLFIPFIGPFLVWNKIDEALAAECQEKGITYNNNWTLWVILYFVSGVGVILFEYQTQDTLNKIWAAN